jgi:DNA (cytosine-5)-methyltransferase 1
LFADTVVHLKPWRTARNHVIDWKIESRSIFDRKKPLSPNTMARIFAGLRKHSGLAIVMATGGRQTSADPRGVNEPVPTVMPNSRLNVVEATAKPFVMKLSHTKSRGDHTRSADAPLTTITSLQEHALVEPEISSCIINMKGKSQSRSVDEPTVAQTTKEHQFLLESQVAQVLVNHKGKDGRSRTVDAPAFTQCAKGNHQSLVEGEITPFVIGAGGPTGQNRNSRSVDEPVKTIMAEDHSALVEGDAIMVASGGPDVEARSVDEPIRTLLAREHNALVETKLRPFIVTNNHGTDGGRKRTHDVDAPMPAVTTIDAWSVIEPYLIQFFGERTGQEPRTRSVDDPAWTVTAQGRMALVEPQIVAYHGNHKGRKDGNGRVKPVDEPLGTVDTSNRYGVAEAEVVEGDSFLLKSYTGSDSATLDKPAPTVTAFEHLGLVENEVVTGDPNLIAFYGNTKDGQSVDDPLDTVTAKDRFALVEPTLVRIKGEANKKDVVGLYIPDLGIIVDIRFRMLQRPSSQQQ